MPTNAQKTLTDAGYIAVGLGVMGFQQAQIRARAARGPRARSRGCVAGRARDVQASSYPHPDGVRRPRPRARRPRRRCATPSSRASALRDELGKRVEPVVGQVQAQLGDLPERVVQAMEPVAARVRELAGNAA